MSKKMDYKHIAGLVIAVEDIIIVAREEGDAKVTGLHRCGP